MKNILKIIRKIIELLGLSKRNDLKVDLTGEDASKLIYTELINDEPILVARIGANEFNCMTALIQSKQTYIKYIDYINSKLDCYDFDNHLIEQTYSCAGVFPPQKEIIKKFAEKSFKDFDDVDILGIWLKEENLLKKKLSQKIKISLKDIEPYFHKNPWTLALKGKKVLVIHPFATTIKSQYEKREFLFENKNILPDFDLITLRAVQSIAGEKTPFNNWFEALDYMTSKVNEIDFDIAIIGCGAYGLSIGAHIKRLGKKAIHMGGATQILFGIKGKRWDNHPIISKFYNDHWIKALPEETPNKKDDVEEGCYW